MSASENEIKRWALDVSEWFWGTAQGAFNEKQTTSQIIVDAVIGMVPLVGDVTAARDLIAVGTRLAEDPEKREDVAEWVLLVILLFALIPVIGGVIKGVGRLLLKAGKNAADNHVVLEEIIGFLNRIGHGNALKWFKSLDLLKHQGELIAKFTAFADKLIEALVTMRERFGWFLSKDMRAAITRWIDSFKALKPVGAKMIPQALKELNAKLKLVQQAIYKAEWHTVNPGIKNTTYETEARLVETPDKPKPKGIGWKQNSYYDYKHVDGWPDLRKHTKKTASGKKKSEAIAAFSGPIAAVTLKGPLTIYRVLNPAGTGKARSWWLEALPKNGRDWRERFAILDIFNPNRKYIRYEIPAGVQLKAWRGHAAEQFDPNAGQFLPGGGVQLFIELPPSLARTVEKSKVFSTGWGRTLKRYGYKQNAPVTQLARADKLGKHEIESKK